MTIDEEAKTVMSEVEAMQDQGVEEQAEDGALLQADIIVQCLGCLEKGRQTPLGIKVDQANQNDDLVINCPTCSQEEGKPVVIPVIVLVGADAEEVADLIAQIAQNQHPQVETTIEEAVDSSHPFGDDRVGSVKDLPTGVETTDEEKRAFEELERATRPDAS